LEDVSNEEGENNKREKGDEEKEESMEKGEKVLPTKTNSRLAREARKQIPSVPVKDISYPLVPSKKDKERYFARFLDIFNKLEIIIPFREALQQMPLYTKFLNNHLPKKGKYINNESIMVEGSCSAMIQKNSPQKFNNPGSVTILFSIKDVSVGKALLDLGASIKLMPLSMCRRIGNLKIAPTRMMLQLANCLINKPYGAVEDVLIKVRQFTFPVDFVIMDIEDDFDIPLILGSPFMLIAKCVVDMGNGNLEMSVEDQKDTFNLFEAIKHPSDSKTCFKMEEIKQEADLVGQHLKSMFLEEDEVKPVVNPTNPSIVLPGPR